MRLYFLARLMLISLTMASVIGCGGDGGDGGPVKLWMLRTPSGGRPVVWVEPCDQKLKPSKAPYGHYALLVRCDNEPHYLRTLEPDEIIGGCEKDLNIPKAEPGETMSVAVERVIRETEMAAISNRIFFDPADTSAVAIQRPPMPVALQDWVVDVRGNSVLINNQLKLSLPLSAEDRDAFLKFVGPPSRQGKDVFRTMTWDKLGMFARG